MALSLLLTFITSQNSTFCTLFLPCHCTILSPTYMTSARIYIVIVSYRTTSNSLPSMFIIRHPSLLKGLVIILYDLTRLHYMVIQLPPYNYLITNVWLFKWHCVTCNFLPYDHYISSHTTSHI